MWNGIGAVTDKELKLEVERGKDVQKHSTCPTSSVRPCTLVASGLIH